MTKKDKKAYVFIDGTKYRIIQATNSHEEHWMYVPQTEEETLTSGLHLFHNSQEQNHWDYFKGKQKLDKKEYVGNQPVSAVLLNFKNHGHFPIPPSNSIVVLRGSDKEMEFISLEYYQENKEKYLRIYSVLLGDEENPQVLELKPPI